MMDSGIPTDPTGTPIANDPGAVVVRVYRVQPDGQTLRDIGGALVAVGDWGKLIREHEDGLVLDQASTEAGLGSVARMGDGSLVAVGDSGTMVRIRFDAAEVAADGAVPVAPVRLPLAS
jgi:hypothetical protein